MSEVFGNRAFANMKLGTASEGLIMIEKSDGTFAPLLTKDAVSGKYLINTADFAAGGTLSSGIGIIIEVLVNDISKTSIVVKEGDIIKVRATFTETGVTDVKFSIGTIASDVVMNSTSTTVFEGTFTVSDDTQIEYTSGLVSVSYTYDNKPYTRSSKTVTVDNIAPIIVLNGADPLYIEALTGLYTELGAYVDGEPSLNSQITIEYEDEDENSISEVDVNTVGTYKAIYSGVVDTAGNPASVVERTVIVRDTVRPVITLNTSGEPIMYLLVNTMYDDTATATDNYDGVITGSIVKTVNGGSSALISNTSPNGYDLVYNVSDYSTNAADTINRTVYFFEKEAPVVSNLSQEEANVDKGTPVVISWAHVQSVLGIREAVLDKYEVFRDDDLIDSVENAVTSYSMSTSGLVQGDSYYVTVKAVYKNTSQFTYDNGIQAGQESSLDSNPVTFTINDTTAPEIIELLGPNPDFIKIGVSYTEPDPSVSVSDNVTDSADITINKSPETIDTSAVGTKTITYTAQDEATPPNESPPVIRTVYVFDIETPSAVNIVNSNPTYGEVVPIEWDLDFTDGGNHTLDSEAVRNHVVDKYVVTIGTLVKETTELILNFDTSELLNSTTVYDVKVKAVYNNVAGIEANVEREITLTGALTVTKVQVAGLEFSIEGSIVTLQINDEIENRGVDSEGDVSDIFIKFNENLPQGTIVTVPNNISAIWTLTQGDISINLTGGYNVINILPRNTKFTLLNFNQDIQGRLSFNTAESSVTYSIDPISVMYDTVYVSNSE